jgi:hypothetical protein
MKTFRTIRLTTNDRRCIKSTITSNDPNYETTLELNSHANTYVLGWHALITLDHNRSVPIRGYAESLGTKTYKTVSGVVAYTNSKTGRTLHLIINQAIHVPHLDHHLLCPMQCRVNDVILDETPKFLAIKPTDQTHALTVPLTNKKCFDKIKILIVLGRSTLIRFILTQIFNCFALQFMLRVKIYCIM